MKIAILIPRLSNGGGCYQLLNLAAELIKKGNAVKIFTLANDLPYTLVKKLDIKTPDKKVNFGLNTQHGQILGFFYYLKSLLSVTRNLVVLAKRDDFDVINPHEWPAQWAGVILKFIKRKPVVWMCNDVWHISGNEEYDEKRIIFSFGKKILIDPFDFFLTSFVNKTVVLDNRIKRIFANRYHKKPIVVRSGISLDLFKKIPNRDKVRKSLKFNPLDIIILCFSILAPHRRYEDVISAFELLSSKFDNVRLVLLGSDRYDSKYSEKIKNQIKESNARNKITMRTDILTQKEVINYFSALDIFVFPNTKQTWGLVVIEAMAAGKTCIVSNQAGVHEIIRNYDNGIIFEAKNVSDLYNQMTKIVSDQKLRTLIGQRAKEFVFSHFSWEKYASDMFSVFRKEVNIN